MCTCYDLPTGGRARRDCAACDDGSEPSSSRLDSRVSGRIHYKFGEEKLLELNLKRLVERVMGQTQQSPVAARDCSTSGPTDIGKVGTLAQV